MQAGEKKNPMGSGVKKVTNFMFSFLYGNAPYIMYLQPILFIWQKRDTDVFQCKFHLFW